MARPDLGKKYVCEACGIKYYDMNRPDPRCPKCDSPADSTVKATPKKKKFEDPVVDESQVDGTVSEEADEDDLDVQEISMDDESAEARLIEASDIEDGDEVDLGDTDIDALAESELPDEEVEVGVSFGGDDDDEVSDEDDDEVDDED